MRLKLDLATDICREVAAELDPRLTIVGVTATEGGSDRVEVLVTVTGCHTAPCMHLLNVTRSEPALLEQQIRSKLFDALSTHR